ncbi:protein arginine methyltransferase NDUFAF7, mitochondrial isoform X1 [Diprion similis]|uniref:protein arginine methyltransferase NDUFAF7, mitochondrial isoform X1 n=1 Tax=Diprion similis TaxID=362088 RepID=UPI001EF807AB|nr:protein arginine methyltransferase NDUFAF7, mitochondrial isoform X1 [Diprion similis]
MFPVSCKQFIGSPKIVRHLVDRYCTTDRIYRAASILKGRYVSTDTKDDPQKEKSILYRHLYSRILAGGPVTVAEYMREVLTSPSAGYYMNRDVFGTEGDFTTSPEISQLFGEMIAVWSVNEWRKISNRSVQLVELGPGRGTLSKDILRVYHKLGLSSRVSLHLVEVSPTLSDLQAKNLCKTHEEIDNDKSQSYYKHGTTEDGVRVYWYRTIQDVRPDFSIIIAQEFFDAMPIHKFQKTNEGWREILIDIDSESKEKEKFRYVLSRSATPNTKFYISEEERRDHVETSPETAVTIDYIANFLMENGGLALIADYGHDGDRTDTFRAFRNHKQQDPLMNPGTADLTADVDFSLLRRIACQNNRLISFGPVTQRHFLKQLGIDTRLIMLLKKASDDSTRKALISGYSMITDEDKMGNCFKFLSLFPSVLKDHLNKWPVAGFQPIHTPV